MMNEDVAQPDVEAGLQEDQRTSAATIEHTEIRVDVSKHQNDPVITTGKNDAPGVKVY